MSDLILNQSSAVACPAYYLSDIYFYTYIYIYICTYICISRICMCIYMYTCIYTHTYVCIDLYITNMNRCVIQNSKTIFGRRLPGMLFVRHILTYIYINIYIHICIYVYILCIYMYIYAYIYTHI